MDSFFSMFSSSGLFSTFSSSSSSDHIQKCVVIIPGKSLQILPKALIHCAEVFELRDEPAVEYLWEFWLILAVTRLATLSKTEREKLKMYSKWMTIGKLFFLCWCFWHYVFISAKQYGLVGTGSNTELSLPSEPKFPSCGSDCGPCC